MGGGGGGPIDVRLTRDVLPYNPTVITICLGMNDGSYRAFDQRIFDTYVNGYRHILDRLRKELPAARITILTAPAYDDVTRQPGFPGGYNATLKRYGEAVTALAMEYHAALADTNAPLVDALTKAKELDATMAAKLIADRVHPGPGGHMVMAAAVLKAWNAPAVVADVSIDASRRRVTTQANGTVRKLKLTDTGLSFTELDRALPWPLDRDPGRNVDMLLALKATNWESMLNSYQLKVVGLPAGDYTLKVDGVNVTRVTSADLSAGVDLAALPDLPTSRQSQQVLSLLRQHNDLHFRRWRTVQFPVSRNNEPVPSGVKTQMDELDRQDTEAAESAHTASQPKAHTFELTRG